MADSDALIRAKSHTLHAWSIGGALLLATIAVEAAQPGIPTLISGGTLSAILFSSGLLVFAFGFRGSTSVTARRPVGTAALALLAIWLLVSATISGLISVLFPSVLSPAALLTFGYVDALVQFLLALIAVMQIARIGVVPAPWNWVPVWTLLAASVSWVLLQVIGVFDVAQNSPTTAAVLMSVDGLIRMGGVILLGAIALVLSDRSSRMPSDRSSSVQQMT